ncbi:Lar family restriction alleviation protein [Stenotrophomonas sp. RG-453]|uniref:Lar family restriction alleviation protein n=1 Tax=Stenotrophomonas sp. RG-453 TaxID=2957502 RepID=UPI0029CA1F06|nr:Lar family restriction alleviation protein [Stenotrophomonas sp. RG-453]MDX5515850.1 Lar family restriction alleviation protein [Stenotrophomonas sp. RG-453]
MSEIEKRARELLACPFCGGDAAIRNWQDEEPWSHAIVEWQKVHCTECECEGISSCPGYEPDTVQAWNTRAALTPPEGYVPERAMLRVATGLREKASRSARPLERKTLIASAEALEKAVSAARPEVQP